MFLRLDSNFDYHGIVKIIRQIRHSLSYHGDNISKPSYVANLPFTIAVRHSVRWLAPSMKRTLSMPGGSNLGRVLKLNREIRYPLAFPIFNDSKISRLCKFNLSV